MKKEYKDIDRYESYHHSKFRLRYHVIFSTKYRKKCLEDIKNEVYEIFEDISRRCRFSIECIAIDKDHAHFIIKGSPSISIGSIIRRMKQMSTIEIWEKHESHLKKYYWGNKKKIWTNGYFCSTIGEVSEEIVKEYIEKQG